MQGKRKFLWFGRHALKEGSREGSSFQSVPPGSLPSGLNTANG